MQVGWYISATRCLERCSTKCRSQAWVGGGWGCWSCSQTFIWSVSLVILHRRGWIFFPTCDISAFSLSGYRGYYCQNSHGHFPLILTFAGRGQLHCLEWTRPKLFLRGRCYCKAKGTWHPILAATMGRRDASQFGGSDCSRLIEACQVSAEDLGFRVATLSPSLRHIPTASTHLPKINCTALTPSSPPSPSNLAFTSNNEDPCLIQFSWLFFLVLTHIISVGCRWIKHVFHWM